jgi:hypothetical protein
VIVDSLYAEEKKERSGWYAQLEKGAFDIFEGLAVAYRSNCHALSIGLSYLDLE